MSVADTLPPETRAELEAEADGTTPAPDGGDLLDSIARFIQRFVFLDSQEQLTTMVLWTVHTHALDAAYATPYLAITSPERGCGKSQTLDVLEQVTRAGWKIDGPPTEAVLFRQIDATRPTVLLDEVDRLFKAGSERVEPVTAVLNGGNRRGAKVPRLVPVKSDFELRDFGTFCPKVLAGIDHLRWPDTIRDRCIPIKLHRLPRGARVERWRLRRVADEASKLREASAAWAQKHHDRLDQFEAPDDALECLTPRALEGWEPLLAIAEAVGGDWPERANRAAVKLSGGDGSEEVATSTLLLAAIRAAFDGRDRVATKELLDAINAEETYPFGGWNAGEGMKARDFAKIVKPYGITPETIRVGDKTPKGYRSDQFADVWARYLPPQGGENPQQRNNGSTEPDQPQQKGQQEAQQGTDVADVADVADPARGTDPMALAVHPWGDDE